MMMTFQKSCIFILFVIHPLWMRCTKASPHTQTEIHKSLKSLFSLNGFFVVRLGFGLCHSLSSFRWTWSRGDINREWLMDDGFIRALACRKGRSPCCQLVYGWGEPNDLRYSASLVVAAILFRSVVMTLLSVGQFGNNHSDRNFLPLFLQRFLWYFKTHDQTGRYFTNIISTTVRCQILNKWQILTSNVANDAETNT